LKNKLEQFKRLIRYAFILLLVIGQSFIFMYYWVSQYNDRITLPFVNKGNWLIAVYYMILELIFLYNFDGLKFGYFKKSNLVISQILAMLCTNLMIYLQIALLAAGFITFWPIVAISVAGAIFCLAVTLLSEFVFNRCFPAKRLLLIYDEYCPDFMMEKLKTRKDKYIVEKAVNISVGLEKISEMLDSSDGVIIFDVHAEIRNKLVKMCYAREIRAYTTSKVSDILIRSAETIHLFDTPLLLCRNTALTFEQRFIKRFTDIVVSSVLLIITSPFMLFCALIIKLYDGGPVFYRQERYTIGGRIFKIHKFRSMIVDAESDGKPHPATEDDPRITPIGKFLRAIRMDELPQLIDILKGDMSLVGPRPERVEHVDMYTAEVPEFKYRLKVRGGLTGYAQLYGKYNTSAYDKLQLDLMYIQNYSFLLDLRLLFMTVKILFMKESTEGFTEEKSQEIREEK